MRVMYLKWWLTFAVNYLISKGKGFLKYFYNAKTEWLDDMLSLISQHFILFQAQENIDEEDYIYHLTCFIDQLSNTISTRYYS